MLPCRHNWGTWVMALNELTPGLKEKLAPTDCRLRPDQHFMEVGEFDRVRLSSSMVCGRRIELYCIPIAGPKMFIGCDGCASGRA